MAAGRKASKWGEAAGQSVVRDRADACRFNMYEYGYRELAVSAASTQVTRGNLRFHRRFVPRDRYTWMQRA